MPSYPTPAGKLSALLEKLVGLGEKMVAKEKRRITKAIFVATLNGPSAVEKRVPGALKMVK